MAKKKSELKIMAEGKTGRLSITGPIGWSWFGDDWSYNGFRAKLAELGKLDVLEVEISSQGGSVVDGIAIFNALVEQDMPVHAYVNALAASIASVILMAGDKIFIPSNSMVFLHKPLAGGGGNADDMRKNADMLDKWELAMVSAYKRHFKGTSEELHALMASDSWLTAQEMASKFDNVTVMEQAVSLAADLDLSDYPNLPKEVLALVAQTDEDTDSDIEAFMKDDTFKGFCRGIMAHLRRQKPNKQETDMALKPEEKAELVAEITAAVTAALKPVEPVAAVAPIVAPAPAVESPVAEIVFEGDMDKPEDVQAHAAKLQKAQVKAAVDWKDPASVMAYHKTLVAVPVAAVSGPNTAPAAVQPVVSIAPVLTPEAIKAEVDAVNKHRGIVV